MLTDESRPWGGFILAETLVQNGTTGDNGTSGGAFTPVSTRFSGRINPPLGSISSGNVHCIARTVGSVNLDHFAELAVLTQRALHPTPSDVHRGVLLGTLEAFVLQA